MTYIHLFSLLVEAIILLQYSSALFVPKQKTTVSLSVLCCLYLILFAFLSKTMYFAITFLIICFLKRWQKNNRQYDNSLLFLIFIPITSLFVMITLVNIIDQCILSHTLEWLVVLSAVFLLGINLLAFGINQYHLKKNMTGSTPISTN